MKHRTLTGALVAAALASTALVGATTPAYAAPGVNVTPASGANAGGQSFQVSGSGFNATASGGLGVYVAFGPKPSLHPETFFNNIDLYQAAVWTHPGGTGTPTNKNMNANGTFSFTLTRQDGSPLTATYTTSAGTFNCLQIQCGVVTMAAHGSTDRSQDSFTPVTFGSVISNPATAKAGVQFRSSAPAFAGGVAPFQWTVGGKGLPPGLAVNAATGVISGTPSREGVFKVSLQGTDATAPKPKKAKVKLLFRVAPVGIAIGPSSLPNVTVGAAYSATLTVSGGVAPYKYKVTSGALPSKLKLSGKGTVKGKAAGAGSSSFTVTVTDRYKFTASRTFMLTAG